MANLNGSIHICIIQINISQGWAWPLKYAFEKKINKWDLVQFTWEKQQFDFFVNKCQLNYLTIDKCKLFIPGDPGLGMRCLRSLDLCLIQGNAL